MTDIELDTTVVDTEARDRAVAQCRERGIRLPSFGELTHPEALPDSIRERLQSVDPDEPRPENLFRVHWFNGDDRRSIVGVPAHVLLPPEFTGVEAPIVALVGGNFPLIGAHKVLAAYACLVPRILTGRFDPTRHRALWPSTGNFCRGGVAISRILGCRGVAILPEGMSRERFAWLERWVTDPADIVRTPGSESNVKEIYDACAELSQDPANVVFNQFSEMSNHVAHRELTGNALGVTWWHLKKSRPDLKLAAFVAATGSAGTLGAGDALKPMGARIVAVEAKECPTLTRNGFGEHNIQGIGDKHVPLIHNVMNTDLVVSVSDRASDRLFALFNHERGRSYLRDRRGLSDATIAGLQRFGLSGICNLLACIKTAKALDLGPDDLLMTVATDDAAMYGTENESILARDFPDGLDEVAAAETFGEHLLGQGADDVHELSHRDRERIFNLGYFTWVEQRGVALDDFMARKSQDYWSGLAESVDEWDRLIDDFNERSGQGDGGAE